MTTSAGTRLGWRKEADVKLAKQEMTVMVRGGNRRKEDGRGGKREGKTLSSR